ncbi:YeeE/YedE family protein [Microbulbifer bruguierae]|uniref:YeeE/YedE family protein n=1 Tax=Microbulbifer bruguierae TaxID=3029061 RepID=A0ABY8NEK5_9GAMM|nr:YeeE/YedE thiosulfate transporter family protein [Microbulbifer bruguierae]WGL17351.1 YeeE/YedE family protein [Microbulbifer bruguierae]
MTIDWNAFTPLSALGGGLLIGIASAWLILMNGRIAGISGILGGLLDCPRDDRSWRLAFVIGLLVGPTLWGLFHVLPTIEIHASAPVLIAAGLLVGTGTRYAAGCTSGHGVCGLSRLSPRSLAATLTFMGGGFATVFIIRHLLGA